MDNTSRKLKQIINEIEQNKSFEDTLEAKKTTSQIVDIFLNSNMSDSINDTNCDNQIIDSINVKEQFQFDMNELQLWKDKNNQSYKIDYYRTIFSQRRNFGKFVVFFKRLIRKCMRFLIEPIINEQNEFNVSVTASINALYNNEMVTQSFINRNNGLLNELSSKLHIIKEQAQITDEIKEIINELGIKLNDLGDLDLRDFIVRVQELEDTKAYIEQVDEVKLKIEELSGTHLHEIDKINTKLINLQENLNENLIKENEKWKKEINSIESRFDNSELKFFRAFKKYENELIKNAENYENNKEKNDSLIIQTNEKDSDPYTSIDYFNFENYFRGSRKEIKKSQEMYVNYFTGKGKIIELGCGRGEFLELMLEKGIDTIGIDAYEEFVDYCNIKGFNAIHNDAISYLSGLENESIGGVFAAQLVEHLKINQLIQLCNDAYNKLLPGCFLIFETPNPTSLAIYTNAFYVDPSHNKPVHPKTLEYFLSQAGFKNIQVIFTEQSRGDYRLPLLEGQNINNLSEFNDGINCITDVLFGSQDYAIIAQK